MLVARKYIDDENIDKHYLKLKDKVDPDNLYTIKTDKGITFTIKFIQQKMTTINKIIGITDFLDSHTDTKKIIVVYGENINKKAFKQIMEYPNTEIFWDHEFMFNIIEHSYQPKFEIMSKEEIDNFENTYIVTKREMPKMDKTDIIARYYNLNVGDIIRIIRPSTSSGYTISYRVIINSSIDKLFDR
jgi:DNA-directed RNA polymerase subunit H (RpoH/RPB5)